MQEYYRIVFSTDENFVNYLAVCIQSLIENSNKNKKYIISILAKGFSENSKRILSHFECENVKIELYDVKEKLKELNITGLKEDLHWSIAAYYRILIPFLFPYDKKVLYLDSDVIALDDVSKIIDVDLENKQIGAVIDYDTECYTKKRIKYFKEKMNFKDYKKYFNSGVIVFDVQKIEKEKYLKQFLDLLKMGYTFLDQDILNVIFEENVKFLNLEWNYQYHFVFPQFKKLYNLSVGEPKIIHYTTAFKPWNTPENVLCDLWWKYARKTPSYEAIIYKNTSYDLIKVLKTPISFMYRFYKIIFPFSFDKKGLKKKIKLIKTFYDKLR